MQKESVLCLAKRQAKTELERILRTPQTKIIMHPERQCHPSQARSLWQRAVAEAGLVHEEPVLYNDTPPYTALCTLTRSDGQRAATASGKGRNADQAKLSAAYEALEHACCFVSQHHAEMHYRSLSTNAFQKSGLTSLAQYYEPNFFEQIDPHHPITWLPFRSMQDESVAYLPWALFNPVFLESDDNPDAIQSEQMSFLTTGSGIAIGASFEEALIHGLSEAVERDATSTYLKQTFLEGIAPNALVFESLPARLQSLQSEIEKLSGHPLLLTRLPTRIAGFFAYQVRMLGTAYICGYGCSVDSEYALERALLECKEGFDLTQGGSLEADYEPIEHDATLLRCAKNDLSDFAKANAFKPEHFIKSEVPIAFNERYQHLLQLCNAHPQAIYVHQFRRFTNGVTIVIVFVPESSYFFAVQKGYPFDLQRGGSWM